MTSDDLNVKPGDLRKLKRGQPVVVRLYTEFVTDSDPAHPYVHLTTERNGDNAGNCIRVYAHDVVAIEPRPISVGDRVRRGKFNCVVEWRNDTHALLRVESYDNDTDLSWIEAAQDKGNLELVPLSTLTRVESSDE